MVSTVSAAPAQAATTGYVPAGCLPGLWRSIPNLYWGVSERGSVYRDRVRLLQDRLNAWGFNAGPVDGWWGSRTETAVQAFQRHASLEVDGVAGPNTLRALDLAAVRADTIYASHQGFQTSLRTEYSYLDIAGGVEAPWYWSGC